MIIYKSKKKLIEKYQNNITINSKMNTNQIISLNVGGRIFQTTKQTLMSGSEYFRDIFENSQDTNTKEPLFIDRSYKAFEHVLSLLRNPTYEFPNLYKGELDFFGIKYTKIDENDNEKSDNIEIYFINDQEKIFNASKKVLSQYPYFVDKINEKNRLNNKVITLKESIEIFSIIYSAMENGVKKYSITHINYIHPSISKMLNIYKISDRFELTETTNAFGYKTYAITKRV